MWEKCGKLGYLNYDWSTAELVPLFKKGDTSRPTSYRPIALLSHARKVIEAGIAIEIRKAYKFNCAQLGFQQILDLKSAYDKVPRHTLMDVIHARLPIWLVHCIAPTIQDMTVLTRDGTTSNTAKIRERVTQGSPLSPTLFNVYMDTFVGEITRTDKNLCARSDYTYQDQIALTLFADDVKIQAKKAGIRAILQTAGVWATKFGITWSTKNAMF